MKTSSLSFNVNLLSLLLPIQAAHFRAYQSLTNFKALHMNAWHERKGAMDLIWGVIAVVAIVIIIGVGLIILYNVENVADTSGNLSSAQSVSISNTFNNMVGSYGCTILASLRSSS